MILGFGSTAIFSYFIFTIIKLTFAIHTYIHAESEEEMEKFKGMRKRNASAKLAHAVAVHCPALTI
jgi:hypothetical protein